MNILFFLTPKSEVAYIYDTDSLRQALEKMENHRYSAIPIIGKEDGRYIGTLTEGDLLWNIKDCEDLSLKDAEEISRIKKVSMRPEEKKVSDKYKSWFGLSHGQLFNTNTLANKNNWYIKLSLGNKDKYFLNLRDTAMWIIAYCHLGSPKDEKNVNKIMKNINDSLNNNGKAYNFKWERNGNYA